MLGFALEVGAHLTDEGDVLNDTDAQRADRLDLHLRASAVAMLLGDIGRAVANPETDLVQASNAARVRDALREILDALDPPARAIIHRRFFLGESMTAIFGPAGTPDYKSAYDKHARVLKQIAEALREKGISPDTARGAATGGH